MDFDDIDFDDVLNRKKMKKNSGRKGKHGERTLAKILKKRFNFEFSRSIGSGNRWSQVSQMPEHARQTFSADLVCPVNFRFAVECKNGYEDIDLVACLDRGNKIVDGWIQEVSNEAKRCSRCPLIVWKRNYKPWIAFIQTELLDKQEMKYKMDYREWTILSLNELLALPDEIFYK